MSLRELRPRRKDILTPLPPEIQALILKNLRLSDILTCCQVCKIWNNIISSHKYIWMYLCKKSHLAFRERKNEPADSCKRWFLHMRRRLLSANLEAQFISVPPCDPNSKAEDILAFHVYESLIAVATENFSILVYKYNQSLECILKIDARKVLPKYAWSVTSLRLDGTIIAVMDNNGSISAWSIESGQLITLYFTFHYQECFDLLKKTKIVAHGGHGYIQITNINSFKYVRTKVNEGLTIHKVAVRSHYFENQPQVVLLFCIDLENLSVFKVENIKSPFNPKRISITRLQKISPPGESTLTSRTGFCFDGSKYLYYHFRSSLNIPNSNDHSKILSKVDILTGQQVTETISLPKSMHVHKILGAGKEILLFTVAEYGPPEADILVYAASHTLKSICLLFRIPKRKTPFDSDLEQTFIGETSWLNGINEDNDRGIICAYLNGFDKDDISLLVRPPA